MRSSLTALLLSAALALPLAGCAATDGTGASATNASINTALENAADEARSSGNNQESLDLLERIYKRDPANADSALKYATALQDAGRSTRALMVLTPFASDSKADKNAPLQVEYASVQASVGNYDQAVDAARKATAADPTNPQAWHVLGIALDAKGEHPEAEQAFRSALQNWRGDPSPVLNNLGLNLASQGFIDEAVETLKKAVSLAPDRPEIERNLRIVLALQSQPGTHENKRVPPPPRKPDNHVDTDAQAEKRTAAAETKPVPVEKAVADVKPSAAPAKAEKTAEAKAPAKPAKVAKAKAAASPAKLNASDMAITTPEKDSIKAADDNAEKQPTAEKASVVKPAVVPNGRNDT